MVTTLHLYFCLKVVTETVSETLLFSLPVMSSPSFPLCVQCWGETEKWESTGGYTWGPVPQAQALSLLGQSGDAEAVEAKKKKKKGGGRWGWWLLANIKKVLPASTPMWAKWPAYTRLDFFFSYSVYACSLLNSWTQDYKYKTLFSQAKCF